MGARTNEVALILCLFVLAGAIAVSSERLVPPVFGVKVEPIVVQGNGTGPSNGSGSKPGTLVIRVTSTLSFGREFTNPYVSNATILVVPAAEIGTLFPVSFRTNSSGEWQDNLIPLNYSVSILDLPMNVSVPLQVHEGETTQLDLAITGNTYNGVFLNLPANQSNVVPAWAHGTMEVGSSVALLGSTAAFLDLHYTTDSGASSGQTVGRELETPIVVTASNLRSSGSVSDEWISFQPQTQLELSGLASVELSVFGAYTNVTISGGNTVGY
jgi:hypothetical protein